MSELQQRKKLLVAEAEVYREMLKLEFQTFRLYGIHTKRRISSIKTYTPLLLTGVPLLRALFSRRRRSTWKQLSTMFYLGWQAYNRFGPLLRRTVFQRPSRTAAEEYLSKRI